MGQLVDNAIWVVKDPISDRDRAAHLRDYGEGLTPWPVECQAWEDGRGREWLLTQGDWCYWVCADAPAKLVPVKDWCSRCGCPLPPGGGERFCRWCRRTDARRN